MEPISVKDSKISLRYLLETRENLYYESKCAKTKPTKLANELIGMLNANGGVVALGITDDGKVDDLNQLSPDVLNHFRKVVHDCIAPPAKIELEEIVLNSGELIFLYHAEHDHERLFRRKDNEEVFLRVADSNKGPLKRDEVKILEYNKSIRSFEDETREDFDPGHLRRQTCADYLAAMSYKGTFEELLLKRGLATKSNGSVLYKNAAVLLFAEDPAIYIPSALVRYIRYEGTESRSGSDFNVVKDERLEGNIPELVRTLETFMEGALRDYYSLNINDGKFEKIPECPKAAWLEAIVNALCHRSYNLQGNSIYIKHFDDRIVISNSGPLPAQVTVENIRTDRYSRNPRIARALSDMGYVRELNEGVPRIFNEMRRLMLAEPEYTNTADTVTLTLRNKVASRKETIHEDVMERVSALWHSLSHTQRQLLHYLFQNFDSTLEKLSQHLELSEQGVRYNLKKLEEFGIVVKESDKIRDRNAIYRLPDQ
ncbi:MAG: hypothetical protein RLZZ505_968 [Verrucomicrobiota bacterium]|jgi:ATP-dependent DNA helicase RecG